MATFESPLNDPSMMTAADGPANNHNRPVGGNGVGGPVGTHANHDHGVPYTPLTEGPKDGVAAEGIA